MSSVGSPVLGRGRPPRTGLLQVEQLQVGEASSRCAGVPGSRPQPQVTLPEGEGEEPQPRLQQGGGAPTVRAPQAGLALQCLPARVFLRVQR